MPDLRKRARAQYENGERDRGAGPMTKATTGERRGLLAAAVDEPVLGRDEERELARRAEAGDAGLSTVENADIVVVLGADLLARDFVVEEQSD